MNRLVIDNISDIADFMHNKVLNEGIDVTFIGLYTDVIKVIKDLLIYDETNIYQIAIESTYDKEYVVSLDSKMNIWCEKAYRENAQDYLYLDDKCILVADDCNSAVLKRLDSPEIYEVSYKLDEEDNINTDDKEVSNYVDNSTHLSFTKDGKLDGFMRTVSSENNGVTSYSSYSFYANDEKEVKRWAKEFGIDI